MTPEEIRRRLPGAPEEAIKQLIALDKHHRELGGARCGWRGHY